MPHSAPYPVTPVILSGGSGTRLWPLSRKGYPKQFLPLADHRTLFASTLERALAVEGATGPMVVANAEHRFLAAEQLRHLGIRDHALLLEPCGRNTAPAIAAAAHHLLEQSPAQPPLMLVLPADHVIADMAAFQAAVSAGAAAAVSGRLVTFGIRPDRPETGFGYIRAASDRPVGDGVYEVDRFVEKPDAAAAERYLASGDYTWNSGMFLLRADVYLDELKRLQPAIAECAARAVDAATADLDFIRLDEDAFAESPAASIDYAVMEHTGRAAVVPLDCGWNDVGAWSALWEVASKDADGNVINGDAISVDSRNNYIRSEHRLIAAVGVADLVIVETPDAVLVADRARSQAVRQIVDRLIAENREEAELHREVHRPWGTFDCIDHAAQDGIEGFVSVLGGKATTMRAMAERTGDLINAKTGRDLPCRTRTTRLEHYRRFYGVFG